MPNYFAAAALVRVPVGAALPRVPIMLGVGSELERIFKKLESLGGDANRLSAVERTTLRRLWAGTMRSKYANEPKILERFNEMFGRGPADPAHAEAFTAFIRARLAERVAKAKGIKDPGQAVRHAFAKAKAAHDAGDAAGVKSGVDSVHDAVESDLARQGKIVRRPQVIPQGATLVLRNADGTEVVLSGAARTFTRQALLLRLLRKLPHAYAKYTWYIMGAGFILFDIPKWILIFGGTGMDEKDWKDPSVTSDEEFNAKLKFLSSTKDVVEWFNDKFAFIKPFYWTAGFGLGGLVYGGTNHMYLTGKRKIEEALAVWPDVRRRRKGELPGSRLLDDAHRAAEDLHSAVLTLGAALKQAQQTGKLDAAQEAILQAQSASDRLDGLLKDPKVQESLAQVGEVVSFTSGVNTDKGALGIAKKRLAELQQAIAEQAANKAAAKDGTDIKPLVPKDVLDVPVKHAKPLSTSERGQLIDFMDLGFVSGWTDADRQGVIDGSIDPDRGRALFEAGFSGWLAAGKPSLYQLRHPKEEKKPGQPRQLGGQPPVPVAPQGPSLGGERP